MTSSRTEERRPGEKAASSKSLTGDSSMMPSSAPDSQYPRETLQRRYWAQQQLDAGAGWPVYGSPAWNCLPIDDPRRLAACVAAAEHFTRRYDDLEDNLRREIEDARRANKRADEHERAEAVAAHRAQWRHLGKGNVIDFAERQRRAELARAELAEIARRNPDGRPGGGAS